MIINAIALTAHHQPWQRVNAHIVNTGALEKFDVFWLPGGWSGDYWSRLSTQGMEKLRQPVDVVATYAQTGEPAAIAFQYGAGQVFLGGLHFEIGPDRVGQENSIQVHPKPIGNSDGQCWKGLR